MGVADLWKEAGDLRLATSVLQKVGDYKGLLNEGGGGREGMTPEEIQEGRCLDVEYFVVRTALVSDGGGRRKRGC